jgi:NAD(P)-dependent dehydrogenase (short-subunit alcohol dehydrogenase family)
LSLANEKSKGYTSSIVNIASISGVMKGSSGGQFAYAASKAAFTHLTHMLANRLVETKIRVNCIAPGLFPSEMTTGSSDDKQKSQIDTKSSNPAGRPGNDADMGACILFLAGPGGLFLSSQVIYPEGWHILVRPATV